MSYLGSVGDNRLQRQWKHFKLKNEANVKRGYKHFLEATTTDEYSSHRSIKLSRVSELFFSASKTISLTRSSLYFFTRTSFVLTFTTNIITATSAAHTLPETRRSSASLATHANIVSIHELISTLSYYPKFQPTPWQFAVFRKPRSWCRHLCASDTTLLHLHHTLYLHHRQ